MKLKTVLGLGLMIVALAACSGGRRGEEIAQRDAMIVPADIGQRVAEWNVQNVKVIVPAKLAVSEANSYYPRGDIVWRGDPPGDRRAQVAAVMLEGIGRGLKHLNGPRPVDVQVNVVRFHSISEKTRASVGGVHNMIFYLTMIDRRSGEAMLGPIRFEPDLNAFGGGEALAAEARGDTQKVRIVRHLENVMRLEFPGNLKPEDRVLGAATVPAGPAKDAVIVGAI